MAGCMMIMAGGTGGHVFPALAVATEMQDRGWDVFWLGTQNSFEARVIPQHGIEMQWIRISALRGKGMLAKLLMPWRLLHAMWQAMRVIHKKKPNVILGMGGFVSGPGGLVARLMSKPLVIQEQNTIPGMTNRWLAKFATRVFEAFPGSFENSVNTRVSGNPVRKDLLGLPKPEERSISEKQQINLLVLGGSLGAQALNKAVPAALALIDDSSRPQVKHQAGKDKLAETQRAYQQLGVNAEVIEFVDDMAAAYQWADLVVCRSGALTVSELMAVGVASVLVPFPHAVDDHQTHNGNYLVDNGAAEMLQQSEMNSENLAALLQSLVNDQKRLLDMASAARRLAITDAAIVIANACEEVAL